MTTQENPLRTIADSQFGVDGGTTNLIANGIYSVDEIVRPILTEAAAVGDPRLFVSVGARRTKLRWRRVNSKGWISAKKSAQHDKDTILQIRFHRPRRLNHIAFELLKVPQTFKVRYYDSSRRKMVLLTDDKGRKVEGDIHGQRIDVLHPGKDTPAHKWRRFAFDTPKIRTNLIEITLNRDTQTTEDFFGLAKDTPYALGVRNLKLKMRSREDNEDDDGVPTPIGTTERPFIVRHTPSNAHDGDNTTYWECAPQGAAESVVPFFIDARASDGTATIFDSLKLVPLWPGPAMSMYWSDDDVTTPWTVSGNRVDIEQAGDEEATFEPETGLLVDTADAGGFLSNDSIRADLSKDFMVGLEWTPTETGAGDRWLWAFEDGSASVLGLKFNRTSGGGGTITGTFKVMQNAGTLYTSGSYTLSIDDAYGVVLGYNHNDSDPSFPAGFYLAVTDQPTDFDEGTAPDDLFPAQMYIGNNVALTNPALGYISRLWMRQDSYTDTVARSFIKNSDTFVLGEGDQDQRVNGYYNALLVARLQSSLSARVGPGAGYFRSKEWTPIPVDYSLVTSQYDMPLTTTKFLKLEFSNLVPRTYITDEEFLIVRDFPVWIKDWHRGAHHGGSNSPWGSSVNRTHFEAVPTPTAPGDPRKLASVRSTLQGRGGTGIQPIIYHNDQSTLDFLTNRQNFDGATTYKELEFAAVHMRFIRRMRHEYETREVSVQRRAFFVGIKELQLFRRDHAQQFDTPEYVDAFDDDLYIASNTGFINVGASFSASAVGDEIESVTFDSFSRFATAQVAVLDSAWESMLTAAQINLGGLTHLTDPDDTSLDTSTTTDYTVVTGQYQGARGGNVIQVTRDPLNTADPYGVKTTSGIFDGTGPITGDNPRVSAVVRMQLPTTNAGTYELRLLADNGGTKIAASKILKLPIKTWREVEIGYIAVTGDSDWQVEVVQLDTGVSEPMVIDMLGVWQNPIKWEISNDAGANYQTLLWPLNKATGYVRFSEDDSQLKVRITALKAGAVVSGWTVVPWYLESSMVIRSPIDYNPPWGVSDNADLLDTGHKPMFRLWNHYFPQRFSVNLYGLTLDTL